MISLPRKKPQRSTMRLQATFSFFIFLQLFHFFTLLVAPSSSSLLPPRPSFLLVPLSSLSLFPPCPSFFLVQNCQKHLEFVKGHFSSILTKALPTNQRTNQPTNRRTDKASYRDARTHLKREGERHSTSSGICLYWNFQLFYYNHM